VPPLNPFAPEAKLIQVIDKVIRHANKSFLSQLGGFFPHFSLWVERWLWIGRVVSFGGFNYFLLLVVVGARDELRSILLTLVLTSLKANTQFICGFGCTLLNSAQILPNHFLAQNSLLKMCSQLCNLLLQLCVLFDSMEKLTLERTTHYAQRSQNSVARRMIKYVLKIFNLNGSSLQIRSKQRTTRASTKQSGTSFELFEF
jgi:hypothetical protein